MTIVKNHHNGYVVTGTDTNIGKTVFCAGLTAMLDGYYWKPVQAGTDHAGNTDSDHVRRLSGLPHERILPEAYRLSAPLAPDQSAQLENVVIDSDGISLPPQRPLIVEGAGGALVPLNAQTLYADLFARWGLPVIIVASTRLGTINHSLLTIEALRARGIVIHGVAFVGEPNPSNDASIARLGGVDCLGRLPMLDPLNSATLIAAFSAHFSLDDF